MGLSLRGRRERAFLAWAAEHAIRLEPLAPDLDVEVLAPLDPLLEAKRIAFLGEANHFVHEKYAYRILFIRYLHSRGFRWLGEELGRSDGVRVARYLATGDAAELERVALFGYRGAVRSDRDDRPTGVLREIFDGQPEAALRAEQLRFLDALRRSGCAGGTEGLRFFGFDIDYEPGVGYELLAEILERLPEREPFAALRSALVRHPGESLEDEIRRLRRGLELASGERARLEAALGPAPARELLRRGATTLGSHEYVHVAHPAASYAALAPALALRERLMIEHVEDVLAGLPASDKVILLSHDLHLAKDDAAIASERPEAGPGGGRVACLGSQLARRHPGEIFCVWMLEERGTDSRPLARGDRRVESARGTLNLLLGRVGGAFALPTASRDPRARGVLGRGATLTLMYGAKVRAVVADQADALCFVREVSPLRA